MQVQVRMIATVFATVFKTEKGKNITPLETGGLRRGLLVTIKLDWKKKSMTIDRVAFHGFQKKIWSEYDATDEQKTKNFCKSMQNDFRWNTGVSSHANENGLLGVDDGSGDSGTTQMQTLPLDRQKNHDQLGPRGPVNKGGKQLKFRLRLDLAHWIFLQVEVGIVLCSFGFPRPLPSKQNPHLEKHWVRVFLLGHCSFNLQNSYAGVLGQ